MHMSMQAIHTRLQACLDPKVEIVSANVHAHTRACVCTQVQLTKTAEGLGMQLSAEVLMRICKGMCTGMFMDKYADVAVYGHLPAHAPCWSTLPVQVRRSLV